VGVTEVTPALVGALAAFALPDGVGLRADTRFVTPFGVVDRQTASRRTRGLGLTGAEHIAAIERLHSELVD
jgi:hypothetical protein